MLENIDSDLGGSDSSPTGDTNSASNFMAGASVTPESEASPSIEFIGLQEGIQPAPTEVAITRTIQQDRHPTSTSSNRLVVVYGTSRNVSTSTEAANSTRSSTDGSIRQSASDVQGVLHLLILALCMSWFM
jgi:hypothetical protein